MPPFSASCRLCPRLARHLDQVRREYPAYHARPVASFGAPRPRFLVVGLAPGMHGANRSGRPFTGDHAGILLYETLHHFGFAARPISVSRNDGLELNRCRITNAVKCLPPANKPAPDEIKRCNRYLKDELTDLPRGAAILALGKVAHDAVLMACQVKRSAHAFRHGAKHWLPQDLMLFDSYHCSRYNTQTGRLTPEMFRNVFADVFEYVSGKSASTIVGATESATTARAARR